MWIQEYAIYKFLYYFIYFLFFINVHKAPVHAHQIFAFIVTYKFSPAHVSYGVMGTSNKPLKRMIKMFS